MSKAELARKAGLSPLTIDRVEAGKPSRMDTRRKIILALGYKLSERHKVFPEEGSEGVVQEQLSFREQGVGAASGPEEPGETRGRAPRRRRTDGPEPESAPSEDVPSPGEPRGDQDGGGEPK